MVTWFSPPDFVPSLQHTLEAVRFSGKEVKLAFLSDDKGRLAIRDRHEVTLVQGGEGCVWMVPSLRELLRGDRPAPVMSPAPPAEYDPWFLFLEWHVVLACDALGDATDGEFRELFTTLGRRPDGRSLGLLHDCLWQTLAWFLATRPVSAAEYEAILGRLALSAKHFSLGLVSRNYIESIRKVCASLRRP